MGTERKDSPWLVGGKAGLQRRTWPRGHEGAPPSEHPGGHRVRIRHLERSLKALLPHGSHQLQQIILGLEDP